jgi:hypothetical protein
MATGGVDPARLIVWMLRASEPDASAFALIACVGPALPGSSSDAAITNVTLQRMLKLGLNAPAADRLCSRGRYFVF